jgi:hypothetical protein
MQVMGIEGMYLVSTTKAKPIYYYLDGRIFTGDSEGATSRWKLNLHDDGNCFMEDMHTGRQTRVHKYDLIYLLGVEVP